VTRRKDIENILRNGKRLKGKEITIVYLPNSESHDKYAVLVGRKHGNAVSRNRLKRVLREKIRRELDEKAGPPYYDVLFCPKCTQESRKSRGEWGEIAGWKRQLRP
jgi:ribonuclease P protein component